MCPHVSRPMWRVAADWYVHALYGFFTKSSLIGLSHVCRYDVVSNALSVQVMLQGFDPENNTTLI